MWLVFGNIEIMYCKRKLNTIPIIQVVGHKDKKYA